MSLNIAKSRRNSVNAKPSVEAKHTGKYWGEIGFTPGITVERVLMTPEMAEAFLDKRAARQRKIRRKHVESIIRDIKSGRWRFNCEPIMFDEHGYLVNGQHRCLACMTAEIAIDVIVIRGVPVESYDSIDNTAKRSGGDAIRCFSTNPNNAASALSLLYRYENNVAISVKINLSPTIIAEMLEANPEIDASVNCAGRLKGVAPSVSTLAFCHYVFSRINKDDADKFFHDIATGENLPKGSPALTIRNRFINDKIEGKAFVQWQTVHHVFRAWNATRIGKPMHVISPIRDDAELPTPI